MSKIINMILVFLVIIGYGQNVKEFKPLKKEDYLVEIRGETDELIVYNIKSKSGQDSLTAVSLRTSTYRTDISKFWEWRYRKLPTESSVKGLPRYFDYSNLDQYKSSATWLEEQNLPEAKNKTYCYSYFMVIGWKITHRKVMKENPNKRKLVELTFLDLTTGEKISVSEGMGSDDKVWYRDLGEYTEINLHHATGGFSIGVGDVYHMISKPVEIRQGVWVLFPEFDANLYHNFIPYGYEYSLNRKINKNEKIELIFEVNPNTGDGRRLNY